MARSQPETDHQLSRANDNGMPAITLEVRAIEGGINYQGVPKMRFMVIRKADAETEAGVIPNSKLIDDMTSYNEKLVRSGHMKEGAGLMKSAHGARVSFRDGKPSVIDGPFAEAKELIAGYSIIEAASLAEVVALVKDWPQEDGHGNVQIEIRQIFTAEDLGFDEEQQARYARLEQEAAQQQ